MGSILYEHIYIYIYIYMYIYIYFGKENNGNLKSDILIVRRQLTIHSVPLSAVFNVVYWMLLGESSLCTFVDLWLSEDDWKGFVSKSCWMICLCQDDIILT